MCLSTMVPLSELEELKKQAEEIQKKINELTSPTSIATACKKVPYIMPRFEDGDCRNPVTFREFRDSDVWKCFLQLGKQIHAKNGTFVQRSKNSYWPYSTDEVGKFVPKNVNELTREEVAISAEMIDRMVEIYNEYMVKLHTEVHFKSNTGEMMVIPVIKPLEY